MSLELLSCCIRDWLWLVKHQSYKPGPWDDYAADYDRRVKAIVEWNLYGKTREGSTNPRLPDGKGICGIRVRSFMNFSAVQCRSKFPKAREHEHTYLCGATGSGKTELLKLFIHSYIVNDPDTALVIIEPTGKLSTEVAKFKENFRSDRLIYVTYESGRAPCINPLHISGVPFSDTSTAALDKKAIVADELVGVLGEMISEAGVQFTTHMETALRRCLLVLLDKKDATLRDLVHFMNDAENDELVQFALTPHLRPGQRLLFQNEIQKPRSADRADQKLALFAPRLYHCRPRTLRIDVRRKHHRPRMRDRCEEDHHLRTL